MLKTEGMQDGVRSLTLPINATAVQRREKSQVVRGEGRLDLEESVDLGKRFGEIRGNSLYLEREDWCRKSETS